MEHKHQDIIELLGAYALDAVDLDEAAAIDAHLPTCPRCAAEVADFREVAAALASSGAPAPEGLWARISDQLTEAAPPFTAELPVPASLERARRRRFVPTPLWVGAAAAALVLVAATAIGIDRVAIRSDAPQVASSSIESLARRTLDDPSARTTTMSSDATPLQVTVTVAPDGSGYLFGSSLPPLGADQTYQLWSVRDDAVVSVGVLGPTPGVVAFHTAGGPQTFAVTVEQAGGVVASSQVPLVVGTIS